LDDFLNGGFFLVGVHSGENDTGCASHLQVLCVFRLLGYNV